MKPILFKTEMVKAILDGRKTQTRRIIKPQPEKDPDGTKYNKSGYWCAIPGVGAMTPVHYLKSLCPYGKVGDTLYVRETWARASEQRVRPPRAIVYRADWAKMFYDAGRNWALCEYDIKWRSSIHMPKACARLFLEITDIRVERVRDISVEDCLCEGTGYENGEFYDNGYIDAFKTLWDSINKKRGFGWEVNPFVWVVEFKQKGQDNGK